MTAGGNTLSTFSGYLWFYIDFDEDYVIKIVVKQTPKR